MNKFVGLSYGAYPAKVAKSAKVSIKEAENIFNNYHNKLYPGIAFMREKVLDTALKSGKVHLGLGCYINTANPHKEVRTIFNACSQFWSILTLLVINKLNILIRENNLQDKVEVVSTIYDSIYLHILKDKEVIRWVNDTIIELMTKDFLIETIVHNAAEGELGYNWCDTVAIPNNASIDTIQEVLNKLDGVDNASN